MLNKKGLFLCWGKQIYTSTKKAYFSCWSKMIYQGKGPTTLFGENYLYLYVKQKGPNSLSG